ncbi:hypothetical protein BU24DRAFT_482050 [Aaosphaeria arxii CBS 175.79]|uniref:Uncharacterized protein n=1 Tax=Aaosphaeria arxii CBS 175.79 TaxID=1450172 RepID=A0A6A5XMU5_9PLEO|nr:uncharacterized protein BU24DRAFT_482050 [Aaosphaeria arxii CBS 175.79]KAF2014548.1 hypothetical protein BU24DRAFT_482050 [Aaosphaeria arxii CBS 175.79]
MATVSGADYDVHLGFWTNWSHNRANGATITLKRKDGDLLISFIAIFVALSGKSFWRICCFITHRCLSTITPQDGLYHQRQAILRNADTPEDGAWRIIQALLAWRKNARRPILRLLPLALLAWTTFSLLLVGGIFSSRLTSDNGSEVLLTGKHCGPTSDLSKVTGDDVKLYRNPQIVQRSTAHSNYALQCHANTTGEEDCRLYVKPWIQSTVDRNASCPFAESICKSQTGNIRLDSGFIDSHHDLGINRPQDERFQMRFVTQCAPIKSEGHKTILERPNDVPVAQYWYGNISYLMSKENYTGFTFEVLNNYTHLDLPSYAVAVSARPEYGLGTVLGLQGGKSYRGIYSFEPIPELIRNDADVALLFLTAQGIGFSTRVTDPWFSASEEWLVSRTNNNVGAASKKALYLTDEPASTLGCAQQVQFCNPNRPENERCETLEGMSREREHSKDLWNEKQLEAIAWAESVCPQEFVHTDNLVASIGTSVLLARTGLGGGIAGPIPDNQWQLEIEHLIASSLASLQGTFVESANGPRTEELKRFQVLPETAIAKSMCKNQKIRSSLYSSFSALPLIILLIIGTSLIVVDIGLEPALNAWQEFRAKSLTHQSVSRSTHSRLEWRAMSFLQLQRMAHQGIGSGTWFKTTSENPVTLPYQELGMLDIRDQKIPRLRTMTEELCRWYEDGDDSSSK